MLIHKKVFADADAVATTGRRVLPDASPTTWAAPTCGQPTRRSRPLGGAVAIQIHNVTEAVDMLATGITIDSAERTSYTATANP